MQVLQLFVTSVVIVLSGIGIARATGTKMLVPGNSPLTQDMVDDYCKLAEWRLGPTLTQMGGRDRLAQLIVNDWKNGDEHRQKEILADLKWWREEFPKLSKQQRELLAGKSQPPGGAEQARQSAQVANAIRLLQLQQWNDARQQQILAISNSQAKHHELMMQIIRNLRPTGHYEYNLATGRYDRYVP